MTKKILVTGANGQLGSELKVVSKDFEQYRFDFRDRKGFDLSSEKEIKTALSSTRYDFIINAGAYTAVDKAESDLRTADRVNNKALVHMAKHADPQTKLIHVSSDYVYHSRGDKPIQEHDSTNPKGVYAITKLNGENNLLKNRPDALIIRTSWVYSSFGNNFVKTMLRLGRERSELNIVSDQYGTPTYARDLAQAIMDIIQLDEKKAPWKSGVYNFSNSGLTNWADFAREIFRQAKINCNVGETTTKAYNAPAPRPLWSMMCKQKIQRDFHLEIHPWKESLRRCLDELGIA